ETQNQTAGHVKMILSRTWSFAYHHRPQYIKENWMTKDWWKHHIKKRQFVNREEHHRGPDYKEVYTFRQKLRAFWRPEPSKWTEKKYGSGYLIDLRPMKALIVEMAALTGVRHEEIREARWKEFEGDTWNVPPEHRKGRKTHKYKGDVRPIPITPLMQEVLDEARRQTKDHSPDALVFARPDNGGVMPGGHISTFVQRSIKWPTKIEPHGFRS